MILKNFLFLQRKDFWSDLNFVLKDQEEADKLDSLFELKIDMNSFNCG